MNILTYLWSQVMTLLEKVKKVVDYNAQLKQENADLRVQLQAALSNDAADAQAIADATALAEQAQLEAQAAKDAVAPLQAAVDADADEDEQIEAILGTVIYPEEPTEPVV
jgi:regulator of replication initiation timing